MEASNPITRLRASVPRQPRRHGLSGRLAAVDGNGGRELAWGVVMRRRLPALELIRAGLQGDVAVEEAEGSGDTGGEGDEAGDV